MAEDVKLDSVGLHQVRSEYVDWGSKSASPAIRDVAAYLSFLLAESRELVPGPTSEVFAGLEETTASQFSNETNRVLRLAADLEGGRAEFDIVIQYAAPTSFISPYKQEG
ncbi:hypothetical protein M2271_002143 [Streptomyces sp. LBL]|uniref:hypothetical protein n=1 Tax=Streptomyces sp. LBL TaxID=2940562 RepID=UPI00247487B5|nr:hypothetical protein [Streptomyces sp. LBL]MDH6624341.1 hypothetical protein [Streptomyces sp. LBL]